MCFLTPTSSDNWFPPARLNDWPLPISKFHEDYGVIHVAFKAVIVSPKYSKYKRTHQ